MHIGNCRRCAASKIGIDAPSQRQFAHHRQKDLHETLILAEPFDFRHRMGGICWRYEDGGAQARIVGEQMIARPIVDGADDRSGHVLMEQSDRAMQHVADDEAQFERLEQFLAQGRDDVGVLFQRRAPIGGATGGRWAWNW